MDRAPLPCIWIPFGRAEKDSSSLGKLLRLLLRSFLPLLWAIPHESTSSALGKGNEIKKIDLAKFDGHMDGQIDENIEAGSLSFSCDLSFSRRSPFRVWRASMARRYVSLSALVNLPTWSLTLMGIIGCQTLGRLDDFLSDNENAGCAFVEFPQVPIRRLA